MVKLDVYAKSVFLTSICFLLAGTLFATQLKHATLIDNEYDIKHWLVVSFVWLFSFLLCFVKDAELPKFSPVTKLFSCVFFVLAICSTFASKHPFWSLVEVSNIVLLINAFLIFTVSLRAINRDSLLFGGYSLFLLFSIFTFTKYILFLIFSYVDGLSFNIHGLISGYVNVRFFNQLQVMILPILFQPFFNSKLSKFESISFVVISLHWAVLLQTEARGGLLSLIFAACLIILFLSKDSRKKFTVALFKTILGGVFLWLVFIIIIPYWLMNSENLQLRTTSSGRVDLWLYVIKSISEHLWLGFGPMSFAWADGKPLPNAHPHNSIMQLLYEYGIITCVAITTWVISRAYKPLVMLKQLNNISMVPIVYAVLAGIIYSLFSGVAVMPFAQVLFVFMVAMLMLCGTPDTDTNKFGLLTRIGLFLLVSAASCLLIMTYGHPELKPAMFPRIWVNGLISY
ncbi:O-antigen ligase family protein [Shewanella algicola]|uniref:O-antigen ligase family protein n=1 Tax=Shewanella algicola TaxID=640633 RepID=UPI0024943750|nr:O-antigen ligase family protein [Shewanella algicola]